MGRYTSGDIEYKFMFGVQSSDAANRFKVKPEYIFWEEDDCVPILTNLYYKFTKNNLKDIKNELKLIQDEIGEPFKGFYNYFKKNKYEYSPEDLIKILALQRDDFDKKIKLFADFRLGEKIKEVIEKRGKCEFYVELE